MKKFAILMIGLLLAASLASCGNLVKLTEDGGKLIDAGNGITYVRAPVCFEPIVLETEPYAGCQTTKLEYYEVQGQPTNLWISELFEGIGGLYYAEGAVTLPSLTEFDAIQIIICVEDVITVGLGQVTDKEDIDAITAAFVEGAQTAIVPVGTSYELKFVSDSDAYEGIYYNLIYVEGDDGENYIYDRSAKTCINVGDVLQEYLPRTTE